jgi:hypothetical protein
MSASSESSGAPGGGEGFTSIAAPSPLRLAGFLGTAIGAAMLGIASVMTWVTVSLQSAPQAQPGVYKGLDLAQGKICLAMALVLLVGLMALRGARSRKTEKIIATVMIVAALLGLAFAGSAILSGFSSLKTAPGDTVHRGAGMFIAAAGGVIATLGAILDLAWAVAPAPGAPAAETAADTSEETS